MWPRILLVGLVAVAAIAGGGAPVTRSYPLDGYDYTRIRRLLGYSLIHQGKIPGRLNLKAGALLPSSAIRLRLAGINDTLDIGPDTPRDSVLQAALERIVGARDPSYRVALLDITDPSQPRYAAIGETKGYIPGSVGKLLVMTGLFGQLHRLFPDDLPARADLLRRTLVTADRFAVPNSHAVPIVADDWSRVSHRRVREGDVFTLWEWVDHMASPSSNAAASMVWKETLLLQHFASRFPAGTEAEEEFLATTPRSELSDLSIQALETPLAEAGLDTVQLRIRTYFTVGASRVVPGKSSYATPLELMRWMVKLEQGKLVDRWSSLEMKKLLYFTRRRYRYAAASALNEAAVYFKSGSLYRCRAEEGYSCGKYRGNALNLMHSVAMVESPAVPQPGVRQRVYLIALMSNVLKVNSALEHLTIATEIERLIRRLHS